MTYSPKNTKKNLFLLSFSCLMLKQPQLRGFALWTAHLTPTSTSTAPMPPCFAPTAEQPRPSLKSGPPTSPSKQVNSEQQNAGILLVSIKRFFILFVFFYSIHRLQRRVLHQHGEQPEARSSAAAAPPLYHHHRRRGPAHAQTLSPEQLPEPEGTTSDKENTDRM